MDEKVVPVIRGERIVLGPLRADLVETYARWMSDFEVTRALGQANASMTIEREKKWLDEALVSPNPSFTIYTAHDMQPIGNTSLSGVNDPSGVCEFGIVIGEKSAWNQGYGTEVCQLMLAYAFDVLGMENVMLSVYAHNPGAIRAYEKAGFKVIGRRRNAMKIGRERYDEILMDAIPADIPPSHLHGIMHDTSDGRTLD